MTLLPYAFSYCDRDAKSRLLALLDFLFSAVHDQYFVQSIDIFESCSSTIFTIFTLRSIARAHCRHSLNKRCLAYCERKLDIEKWGCLKRNKHKFLLIPITALFTALADSHDLRNSHLAPQSIKAFLPSDSPTLLQHPVCKTKILTHASTFNILLQGTSSIICIPKYIYSCTILSARITIGRKEVC